MISAVLVQKLVRFYMQFVQSRRIESSARAPIYIGALHTALCTMRTLHYGKVVS